MEFVKAIQERDLSSEIYPARSIQRDLSRRLLGPVLEMELMGLDAYDFPQGFDTAKHAIFISMRKDTTDYFSQGWCDVHSPGHRENKE